MKKVLLLPLLSACAPTVTGTATVAAVGPFKVGQTWVLTSTSSTERLIPPKTVFSVEKVIPERRTVIGKGVLSSGDTPIQIEYASEEGPLLVGDITPISLGAKKIRTCFFFDVAGANGEYSGVAAHFDIVQTKTNPESFRAAYLKTHPKATDQEVIGALVQDLAADDTGPCTLARLN